MYNNGDARVKSLKPRCACTGVVLRLNDPPRYVAEHPLNVRFATTEVATEMWKYEVRYIQRRFQAYEKEGYYSSGEFARMAHVTLRTIRYYDKQDILKPSFVTPSGARFYTDEDFARLSQILLLKFLGFSLEDIKEMTINDTDRHFLADSLNIQLKLIQDKIEQMQLVERAIQDTASALESQQTIDWSQMLNLIHLTGMEKSLKNQYQNASNISARISLHSLYSQNPLGWFP